ncbi:family 78 glycoside hydrolase catalytic domain [Streptomyces sp. NPDC090106]|uniref:family 78 glycoside hydrolase catalytic domain n=1 Tax=Streptomyces sp. NPDC090106 TaxID=3365946 RepID=UPI003827AB3F
MMNPTTITTIWAENRRGADAAGIDETAPRLSWTTDGSADTYDIELIRENGDADHHRTTGTRLIEWPFAPLRSRERVTVRVRAATPHQGPWSTPFTIEAGLIERNDWQEPFVSPSGSAGTDTLRPAYLLRAETDLNQWGIRPSDIRRARVYATAHGVYELEINGRRADESILAPGWSSYRHRLRYQTYDVTHLLEPGANVLGAWLGDGWYRGRIGFDGGVWNAYGDDVALLVQWEITLLDGTVRRIPLAGNWRWTTSPITAVGLYEGETYDARLLPANWSRPGHDTSGWEPTQALATEDFPAALEAPPGPPVVVTERLRPVSVTTLPDGRVRLDFGQNIAGTLRIRVTASEGHRIRLHHAEVLEEGRLGVRPLRSATSVDTFIGDGKPQEWSPRFTVHGFRYAELENWPSGADIDVEALVVHSDMPRTGWFSASDPRLERLHSNVVWSMRDNFVDLPTDCPQRDERLGWTGDIQVFAPTALFLFAAHGVLTSWLRDVAHEQAEQGHVPNFVPWVECGFPNHPTAAWGDAAVIVPWEMYLNDGDARILRDQYPSMKAWVDLVASLAGPDGRWSEGFQLGDWLDPAAPPEDPGLSRTDRHLIASAYHIRTARILARTAGVLGHDDDARTYERLAEHALHGFRAAYLGADGTVLNDTVTSHAVCLCFDLMRDDEERAHAGRRLARLVADNGFHIATGFVGTPLVFEALIATGHVEEAYALLLQDQSPSWLYPVSQGATTIWERWDSMLPDGSINPGDMTSFNHYALGAVADSLHRHVAGIHATEPGWRTFTVRPVLGGGLTHAAATHLTPYGRAGVSWRRDGSTFRLHVTVPPSTTAQVWVPGEPGPRQLAPGEHDIESAYLPDTGEWHPPVPSLIGAPAESP